MHCCVIDAVFTSGEDGQLRFTKAAALATEELAVLHQQVCARVLRW